MTELTQPIKVDWTGDARQKFRGRKVEARKADGGPHGELAAATLDRLKTRVVVETVEEADALEAMLEIMVDADYSWTTEAHRKAYRRVLKELRDGMETVDIDESTTFTFDAPETDEKPDVWVAERFTNKYGDERAVLAGETYDAKDIIKFDWETTHHKFDKQRKEWIVDADALDALGEKLADGGYLFADRNGETDAATVETLQAAAEAIDPETDDRVTVEYIQKNGNGTNTKTGDAWTVSPDDPRVTFRRDDDQLMWVELDKFGKAALYTGMSSNPYVGAVTAVTVDRDVPTPEDTDTVDKADSDDESDPSDDDSPLSEFGETTTLAESALADYYADDDGEN